MTIVLNGFSSWKFSLFDPVHKFPWTAIFIGNLVNFSVKEVLFCLLNSFFEFFPVFKLFGLFVHVKIPVTIIIPPSFRMLHNVDDLGVSVLYSVNIVGK